jgi:hypothetical protein
MRMRSMIALAVLGALAVVAVAIPAMAHDEGEHDRRGGHNNHERRGGHERPSLGSGGKITLKLLERGESEVLADIYASDNTGKKVKRAMRRGLMVHCHPSGFDTATFTCEGDTTTPETTDQGTTVREPTPPPAAASASATASAPATTP